MIKSELRRQVEEKKRQVAACPSASAAVISQLRDLDLFQKAQRVGVYIPLSDEVNISPLLMETDKTWYIPSFDPSIESYRLARYTPELKTGKFGIPEPENPVFASEDELDLILVPGVVFDRSGNRIGRGGGFYDRLLPMYKAKRVGICFDVQLTDAIPAEAHDIPVDCVVTETAQF
jgi:5-formyltetrahydrofolate cyclo-ligase